MMRSIFGFVAFWIFGLLVPASISPADPGQAQKLPAPPQHEVTVALKLVQVHVADPKGNPALDLEASDFIVYDNGRMQTITAFEKHAISLPAVKIQETQIPQARDGSSLLNRKFILLIDYEHNNLEGIGKSKKAALDFMDSRLQPGDEVALFSTSPMQALALHEYLTTDHRKVREAIAKLKDVPGITPVGGITLVESSAEYLGMEKMTREMIARHSMRSASQVRNFFLSVTELAKVLRQIPGQKNIILFSLGFGRNIMNVGSANRDYFVSMGKELAAANSPVFSVHTATYDTMNIPSKPVLTPETSLEYLSKLTGGKYFDSVNYGTKIAQDIQTATGNYYVLGYSIGAAWDGKFHDIKVEVKRPGYAVYAQKGYFNPLPFNKLSFFEKHLHLLGLALGDKASSNARLDFPLLALPFSAAAGQNAVLLAEIPVGKTIELIGDRVELISLVLNSRKAIVDAKRAELDLRKIGSERVFGYTTAALAPGSYDCRVVLRNMDNGNGAVGACPLSVAEEPAGGPRLFSPLLLVTGPEAKYLNISGQGSKAGDADFSLFHVYPFSPQKYRPLVGEMKEGISTLYAVLRCALGGTEKPAIEVSARLDKQDRGQSIPVSANILESSGDKGAGIYLLELKLPQLTPGRYDLRFLVTDRLSASKAESSVSFWVK